VSKPPKNAEKDSLIATIRRSREQQAATQEILEIISKSREDEAPVFDVILENAANLCNAPHAFLQLRNDMDTHLHVAAQNFRTSKFLDRLRTNPIPTQNNPSSISVRGMEATEPTHYDDIRDLRGTEFYTEQLGYAMDDEGMRTALFVPLISDGQGIGVIVLYRLDVAPFRSDEIALVQTFAAQAVIAIENVRQFREVQERLKREQANREILEVISLNPDDEQPVFDAIINRAAKLCHAPHAGLLLRDADDQHLIVAAANAEQSGYVDYLRANPHSMDDETSLSVEAVRAMEVRQYPDIEALMSGPVISNQLKNTWKLERMRTLLYVPLIKGDRAIGTIAVYRLHVEEFSDDDIEILKLFAAQAVIAIENVRQFKALETLNAELGERVDEQVGEIERMGRLKRFLPSAVADAVVTTGDESMLSSHRALIATLFCDMRGFTAFCEAAEPEETIDVLQTYHQEMSVLIDQYGGGVDQRAGDGIMVIFNDPIPVDNPAGDAVRLAIAMRAKMRELCAGWKKLGHRLGFGVGIALGYATVGMVGSAGRFDYTASGTSVNTAARLCDMAEHDEILISPRTLAAVEGDVDAESRGEVEMKGIREPVEIFAVICS
jgi:class 3 adenylate cyclase